MMIITGFYGDDGIQVCLSQLKVLMEKYILGRNFDINIAN
jgi:hypothetical protein